MAAATIAVLLPALSASDRESAAPAWRDAPMALRWTGAAMQEAAKGFRRLKAHKQLPVLRKASVAMGEQDVIDTVFAPDAVAA